MSSAPDSVQLALRTLEDALARANHGPVAPAWGYRLALARLVEAGLAQPWQARAFWQAMADPRSSSAAGHAEYSRVTALRGFLNRIYPALGLEGPDAVQRNQWAEAFGPVNRGTG